MNTYINYSEAKDEAERLSRVLRRDVEVAPVTCTCDYSKLCLLCAGQTTYYQLVFTSCGHLVGDGEEIECDQSFCREQAIAKAEMDASETFARVSAPLRSCREVQGESEAA